MGVCLALSAFNLPALTYFEIATILETSSTQIKTRSSPRLGNMIFYSEMTVMHPKLVYNMSPLWVFRWACTKKPSWMRFGSSRRRLGRRKRKGLASKPSRRGQPRRSKDGWIELRALQRPQCTTWRHQQREVTGDEMTSLQPFRVKLWYLPDLLWTRRYLVSNDAKHAQRNTFYCTTLAQTTLVATYRVNTKAKYEIKNL